MGQPEEPLIDLGRRVAALQDAAPEAQIDLARVRSRLLHATAAERRSPTGPGGGHPHTPGIALAAALAALVVGVVAGFVIGRPSDPLRFEIGAPEPGVVGAWIAAPPSGPRAIRFSDGSEIDLAPEGRARVTAVDADGAEIALERGALSASVVHRAHTRWTVRVGPFQVHVIGTRFTARWDPATEQLEVALREGAVTVSGPVVGEARAVRAGEVITVSPAKGTIEVGSTLGSTAPPGSSSRAPGAATSGSAAGEAPSSPSAASPASPPPAPGADRTPPSPSASARGVDAAAPATAGAVPAAPASRAPDWPSLARAARYKDALAAAEREGFDALCASSSAADLRALGDAARLGGSPARAAQALTALRARFPGSAEAASAAFFLGRMAQDQGGDHARAASLYERYLAEQPGGDLAAEAAGRLVEARDKMGDDAGARRAAERYLAAYPAGSYAAYARRVTARGGGASP